MYRRSTERTRDPHDAGRARAHCATSTRAREAGEGRIGAGMPRVSPQLSPEDSVGWLENKFISGLGRKVPLPSARRPVEQACAVLAGFISGRQQKGRARLLNPLFSVVKEASRVSRHVSRIVTGYWPVLASRIVTGFFRTRDVT